MHQLFAPDNIFTKLLLKEIKDEKDFNQSFWPSAIISKNLLEDKNSIGIIPTLDIIHHPEFFISSKIGISFNALLSNAYLHFKENHQTIENFYIKGDVSSNEVILSKILLNDLYNIDLTPKLASPEFTIKDEHVLIVGDENFNDELFLEGLSFSEEIIELIEAPYVNFVLASQNERLLKQFTEKHRNDFIDGHIDSNKNLSKFSKNSIDFIQVNLQDVIFELQDQDLEAIKTILQLPFYYGLIENIVELKFV
jgi:hypothetical protein